MADEIKVAASKGATDRQLSVCLFCGSSDAADPDFLTAASQFGAAAAAEEYDRLVMKVQPTPGNQLYDLL
jgi:predicted Rossmann-fold nucleotide-binding protein